MSGPDPNPTTMADRMRSLPGLHPLLWKTKFSGEDPNAVGLLDSYWDDLNK